MKVSLYGESGGIVYISTLLFNFKSKVNAALSRTIKRTLLIADPVMSKGRI